MNNLEIINKIKTLSKDYLEDIIRIRRHIHKYPELSKQELETSNYICNELDKLEIEYKRDIGGYGIMGFVEGSKPGDRCIAFRADMDALPIQEANTHSFVSKHPGIMHACGHDAHVASLIGCIKIIHILRDEFGGRFMFLFQPSEEEYPGGAIAMIEEGVFEEVMPEEIYALHATPDMDVGKVGFRAGRFMASTDEIHIDIIGKGGHGGTPHLVIDPILIASNVYISLQSIVSRNANPTIPTTLSFGKFIGDGKTNIIPDSVRLEGIIRTFDEDWRQEVHALIDKIATDTAKSFGGEAKVFINSGYPFLYNNPETTDKAFGLAEEYFGSDNVLELEQRMTAEDFSYFAQLTKGCYFRIGTRGKNQPIRNLHTNTFDIDEESLAHSMGISAYLIISSLRA